MHCYWFGKEIIRKYMRIFQYESNLTSTGNDFISVFYLLLSVLVRMHLCTETTNNGQFYQITYQYIILAKQLQTLLICVATECAFWLVILYRSATLQWRHNGRDGFQITSLTIVDSVVYLGADQRKHKSSASLAFVREIHRWPVNSPHK